jgi:Rrf2 family protein
MMLSKSTEYAIRALVFVQLQNLEQKRPGVNEIAKEIEAPVAFSAKILHILTTHKLLHSMKGRGGGFFFTDNQTDLTFYDVILAMEGDGIFTECAIGLKSCSDENPCPIHGEYEKVREQLLSMSMNETILSMAQRIMEGEAVLNRINAPRITN